MKRSFWGGGGWTYFTARVLLARGLSTGSFKNPKYSILRYMYNDSKGYLNMIIIVTSTVYILIEIRF